MHSSRIELPDFWVIKMIYITWTLKLLKWLELFKKIIIIIIEIIKNIEIIIIIREKNKRLLLL